MSRIGKQPIKFDSNTQVAHEANKVRIKGPKGEMEVVVSNAIGIEINDGAIVLTPKNEENQTRALWGLYRSLIANAVEGVSKGFKQELELVGVGYRVQKKGEGIELEVGFSHKVNFTPPSGVTLEVEKGVIRINGIDKQKVGQVAANIRAVRPPEPYKGKGIRYVGEVIKLKPGKSAKVGGA